MAKDSIPHAPLSNDYEFCRRIYLDLTGRIPTPEHLKAFVESPAADKRDRLIDELLDSQAWVDHWGYWYGDLLRNCRQPHRQRRDEAFRSVAAPVAQRRQAVRPARHGDAHGVGAEHQLDARCRPRQRILARWHVPGVTMYSDQLRRHGRRDHRAVGADLPGHQLSVHLVPRRQGLSGKGDLDLVSKKRRDFWAMAAFFGKTRVRVITFQDRFTITDDGTGYDTKAASSVRLQREGGAVQPTFILTGEKADPNRPLRPQFARMLTSHPQFARATVNLIWKQFFGLGIVEPVDSFDMARQDPKSPPPAPWTVQPTNPELLDALARDFAAHGFSLKHLMRTHRAVQRVSALVAVRRRVEGELHALLRAQYVRLLTAEQLHDAISQATQVFGNYKRSDHGLRQRRSPRCVSGPRPRRRKTSTTARRRLSCTPSGRRIANSSTAGRAARSCRR